MQWFLSRAIRAATRRRGLQKFCCWDLKILEMSLFIKVFIHRAGSKAQLWFGAQIWYQHVKKETQAERSNNKMSHQFLDWSKASPQIPIKMPIAFCFLLFVTLLKCWFNLYPTAKIITAVWGEWCTMYLRWKQHWQILNWAFKYKPHVERMPRDMYHFYTTEPLRSRSALNKSEQKEEKTSDGCHMR